MNREFALPKIITGEDLRIFRKKYGMSTKDLANLTGVSSRTIERYEGENIKVGGAIAGLVRILEEKPEFIEYYEIPDKKYPLRLVYMHNDDISTIIDVDMMNRRIWFKNYTNKVIFRAFGNKVDVSYEDYEAFLESRCFPKERDKMKLVLEELELPFYDPFLIIKKTEGRMEEDDCWIKVE